MRFQIRLIFIFLSLLVIIPVFLLNTKPALASVAHIVRLKYAADDSPVVGAKVILHTWGYQGCSGVDCDDTGCHGWESSWCDDCNWWGDNGPNWEGTSDSHGIIVFKMTDQSPSGHSEHKIQTCSAGWARPAMMTVVYLNEHNGGYWRFEQLSPDNCSSPRYCIKHDERDYKYLMKDVASDVFGWLWEMIKTNAKIDPRCDEDCGYFNDSGFGLHNNFGIKGNIVKAYINPGDGPGAKNGNFYWEWTWVGNPQAQNTQNQPFLALAGSLWNSILNIFPKKLM